MVQLSLMNDPALRDYAVIAISEPHAWVCEGSVRTTPMAHPYWTKLIPTIRHEERWAFRSMMWIRSDIENEQIPIASTDLTAAVLTLPDRAILAISVYIAPADEEALRRSTHQLRQAIRETRQRMGTRVDVMLLGDFNRHDQIWGGDDIAPARQGEADPIIDLMSDYHLRSLLPRGRKTWQRGPLATTIDLVLVSEELAASVLKCDLHATEHGSDHRAIESEFDIETTERPRVERLLLKNAPWGKIRERVETELSRSPIEGSVQQQTDRLMEVVSSAVNSLTPKARPTPYAKRWWTTDLTQLRRTYTYWRNQSRRLRRGGYTDVRMEEHAREAAKEYHDRIRQQKKQHWEEFLEENTNIWQVAKYLTPHSDSSFVKIPPLRKGDGTRTKDKSEQAETLMATFFPPLPDIIEDEGRRPERSPVYMPRLTMEEVEQKVLAAKPGKAAGEDGLPSVVWKEVWPVVRNQVIRLFQASLDDGELPSQWRSAKIIPLRKPNRGDYSSAKAWRPISLLSNLGKILEAVVAERISFATETFGLLPTNHFGARKRRSANQALTLLQEQVYQAWRMGKVLSLVSFDVKGAYNGVCRERLLQRLRARGIPPALVRWIEAFCTGRSASITINGHTMPQYQLKQAGLPQGSPLSPILFLFFNADLVQRKIDAKGGAIAFVDDYSAWVTGESAEANRPGIEAIIEQALDWERRSGAAFEGEKTAIIHFTRRKQESEILPFVIKGQAVSAKDVTKILGVTMDAQLRYKEHISRVSSKGLLAAMTLRRLGAVTPATARRLYEATVTPVTDYACQV